MRAYVSFPVLLALVTLALLPATLLADTQAKREKKAHAAALKNTQRPAAHPNAHPETQSKQRDTEAKKRLAKDRNQAKKNSKQEKKAEKAAKARKAQPVSQRTRSSRRVRPAKVARTDVAGKTNPATTNPATTDPATASRVHAWENAQKQVSTDPHTASSADFVKAATPQVESPVSNSDKNENTTGTSSPPPDRSRTELGSPLVSQAVSVVSVVRQSPGARPQLPPLEDTVPDTVILPTLYTRRGRLVVPPPLKGSHEILIRQNQVADDEGLDRIQNDDDLERMNAAGLLIAIPSNAMLHVDERLPANRRYCRPWTALFLDTLARQHYARFQTTLQLTSAVRTVEFQQQLIHRNGNAAPAEGDTASPHLTGQAIDIGKKGLSVAEIAWLRGYLLPLVQQGKVDVEEEFQQSCFHISVYKKYLPRAGAGRRSIATTHSTGIDALATGLR